MIPQEYRLNFDMVSYSEIKCFSQCPRLYFERYIAKTLEQEDKDYFTYGQVADTLLTQPWTLEERFVRVTRRTDGALLPLVEEMRDLERKIADLEPQAAANKTKAKSLEKCRRELEEVRARMAEAKSVGERIQVTGAIWDNAHETADVIRENPLYRDFVMPLLDHSRHCFQQMVFDVETHSKGTLDVLYLEPSLQAILNEFRAGKLTKEEATAQAAKVTDGSLDGVEWGFILDIKTTFAMQKLSPAMYAAQLAYYQEILFQILGIRLPCYAIAGDKDSACKVAQDFAYSQDVLDQQLRKLLAVKAVMLRSIELYKGSQEEKWFPAAKTFRGRSQDCMSCSHCKARPYSIDGPYKVTMKDVAEYEAKRR